MTHTRAPMLIEPLLALKWAELDALAALLKRTRRSMRQQARMRPDRWVEHVGELALLSELAGRLENDYRALARPASVRNIR